MGLAAAMLLGRDAVVVLADVRTHRLDDALQTLRSSGIECEAVVCDVSHRESVASLARRAASLGQITSVVHAAGLSPQMGSVHEILTVNALGTLNMTNSFLDLAHARLAMVNVASSAGHLPGPNPSPLFHLASSDPSRLVDRLAFACRPFPCALRPGVAYALSKSFVVWYSRTKAADFGSRGARLLSISPGSFDTEMGRLERASGSGALAAKSALGRFGRVDEIAEVLAFCASDRAGYLTGTDVLVDGGADANMRLRDALAMARSVR
jgi:NAD(P)-dependent dehydrogenase (short-subunit alcohol dehydrogenase family)